MCYCYYHYHARVSVRGVKTRARAEGTHESTCIRLRRWRPIFRFLREIEIGRCRSIGPCIYAASLLVWQQWKWKILQVLKRQLFDRARAWGWGISDQAATRNFTTSPCACEMQLDLFMIHSHPHHLEIVSHNHNNFQYWSHVGSKIKSPWKRNNEALNCSEVWSWYCSPIKAGWIQGRWCWGECDAF